MLRFSYVNTIEFGYDQPLLANQVIEFLKNPSFLDAYRYVTKNPWGFPSWGSAQIFIYAPFLLISRHPLALSLFSAGLNALSIIIMYWIGVKYYSNLVGLISALLLATHPWWVIFSRMIYQPSPIITFVCISMFLLFYSLKHNRKFISILIISWTVLFQLYIHSISFILPSLLLLLFHLKQTDFRYLIVGIFASCILVLPEFTFYTQNPQEITGLRAVSIRLKEISQTEKLPLLVSANQYVHYLAGGHWDWQLGNATEDFFTFNANTQSGFPIIAFVILILLAFLVGYSYYFKTRRKEVMFLFACLLGPVWFLWLIKSPAALPRYLLIGLPPFVLLIGISISNVYQSVKRKSILFPYIIVGIPVGFALFWIYLTNTYFSFITSYTYPKGMISLNSDIPISFVIKSLSWINADAQSHKYQQYIISNNPDKPFEYDLNVATRYMLDNVYNFTYKNPNQAEAAYVMTLKPIPERYTKYQYAEFGPYTIIKI